MSRITQDNCLTLERTEGSHDESGRGLVNRLDEAAISGLSDQEVKEMATDELIGVIRASECLIPCKDSDECLRLKDRRCLIRLAFLARQSIRNQLLRAV